MLTKKRTKEKERERNISILTILHMSFLISNMTLFILLLPIRIVFNSQEAKLLPILLAFFSLRRNSLEISKLEIIIKQNTLTHLRELVTKGHK